MENNSYSQVGEPKGGERLCLDGWSWPDKILALKTVGFSFCRATASLPGRTWRAGEGMGLTVPTALTAQSPARLPLHWYWDRAFPGTDPTLDTHKV